MRIDYKNIYDNQDVKNSDEYQIGLFAFHMFFLLIILGVGVYFWWFVDCEIIKNFNLTVPGRCL